MMSPICNVPSEPERAAGAREARESGEYITKKLEKPLASTLKGNDMKLGKTKLGTSYWEWQNW